MMDKKIIEAIKKTIEDNKELLERLDDYDEAGIPYWEHQLHD